MSDYQIDTNRIKPKAQRPNTCPECGGPVSVHAKACPRCGRPASPGLSSLENFGKGLTQIGCAMVLLGALILLPFILALF